MNVLYNTIKTFIVIQNTNNRLTINLPFTITHPKASSPETLHTYFPSPPLTVKLKCHLFIIFSCTPEPTVGENGLLNNSSDGKRAIFIASFAFNLYPYEGLKFLVHIVNSRALLTMPGTILLVSIFWIWLVCINLLVFRFCMGARSGYL